MTPPNFGIFNYAPPLSPRPPFNGLTYSYYGGDVTTSQGSFYVNEGNLTLPPNTFCFVECLPNGTVAYNTTGFTEGAVPMAEVETMQDQILRTEDKLSVVTMTKPQTSSGGGGGGGGGSGFGLYKIETPSEVPAGASASGPYTVPSGARSDISKPMYVFSSIGTADATLVRPDIVSFNADKTTFSFTSAEVAPVAGSVLWVSGPTN